MDTYENLLKSPFLTMVNGGSCPPLSASQSPQLSDSTSSNNFQVNPLVLPQFDHTLQLRQRTSSAPSDNGRRSTNGSFIPRRPHKKSRQGCFNCKARRVKCQETKPACENCLGRGMECVYPSVQQQRGIHQSQHGEKQLQQRVQSHDRAAENPVFPLGPRPLKVPPMETFTANDLRFFHHFLVVAHPHLPFGSEESWRTVVPAYAHQYSHLMHSILSLGATHLSLITPNGAEYARLAIAHRGKALRALGNVLAKADECTDEELNTMLATCYALTFQASGMADGVVDFVVMVRGCGLFTRRILEKQHRKSNMIFLLRTTDAEASSVVSQLPPGPYADTAILQTSIQTLENIRPLLLNDVHRRFFTAILNTYTALQRSSQEGFTAFVQIYSVWYSIGTQEFSTLVDSQNHMTWILFLHYIALEFTLRPLLSMLCPPRLLEAAATYSKCQWGERIYRNLPPSMRQLVEWQYRLICSAKGEGL